VKEKRNINEVEEESFSGEEEEKERCIRDRNRIE
jgi:hypothetical protein